MALELRHVYHKSVNFTVNPTGRIVATRKGDVIEAASEEEYEWILGVKWAGACCGQGSARHQPNSHGQPIYAPV